MNVAPSQRPDQASRVASSLALARDPANALSFVRLPLAALVWMRPTDTTWFVALMAAAAVSDWLDGFIGRRMHRPKRGVEDVGAWLDPVCDKIFVGSAAAAVAVVHRPDVSLVVLLLLRDIATPVLAVALRVFGGAEAFRDHDFRARWTGKATTVVQFAAVASVMLAPAAFPALAALSALVGLVAVVHRLQIARAPQVR